MTPRPLTPKDLERLAARGIARDEAERQLEVMARPSHWMALVRPCTVGDGIERLDDAEMASLLATHREAAAAGRVSAFVPASGAATRMFKDLLAALERPGPLDPGAVRAATTPVDRALVRFVDELSRFAFAGALEARLAAGGVDLARLRAQGPWRTLLDAFLGPEGLDAARAPKGLLPFHREHGEVRTAFEEHLVEAGPLTGDTDGVRRLEVTVSPEHRAGFERLLADRVPVLAACFGGRWHVRFSEQHPATDTLAGLPEGGAFRDEAGEVLLRPAGHGALIRNLADSGGDLVFLKNIDNVAVSRLKPETERWSRALVGLAERVSSELHEHCRRLERDGAGAVAGAAAFAHERLGLRLAAAATPAEIVRALDRPVRVCGMVVNTGEPGGGPYWVRTAEGVSRQVVESAQVDLGSAGQAAVFRAATHFNPVFLAVALRDRHGAAHALERFVDPEAVIVTRKSHGGRELLALERPGLWNGAMAQWHTRFVEVPLAVFNPVKTVFDLLRPEHQGDGAP
jgi:hypothetical protein